MSLEHAVFHVLNWPDFRGPEDYCLRAEAREVKSCGKVTLEVDGWEATVVATDETDASVKSLADLGGYIITHVGSIRRRNASTFTTGDLESHLTLLTYFFSFAMGGWSGPSLAVGFDESGARVYEEWGLRRSASGPWDGARSWFDRLHSELLPGVFPGFARLWSSTLWHRPLSEAVYWYASANRIGSGVAVDSALLFTQAALELLSWTYCVQDKKLVTASKFQPRGLSAASKLRLLANSLDIPLAIPECLTALRAKRGRKWEDGMDAITHLRNRLVHPGKDAGVLDGAYYDAWRLSQWYIELAVLRLCSYSGEYANRLQERVVGHIEPVPWAVPAEPGA